MDGKGQWVDHMFIKRWWLSFMYKGIYLYAFDTFADANAGIDGRMTYDNSERPQSNLGIHPIPAQAVYKTGSLL
jgi:hypothetical protein